jgi:prepilin-type processing-associated H-X9-DG protein
MSTRRRGFSFIEIVIVVGLLALFMGLVVPSLSKARRIAAAAQCEANLRQWGIAVLIYAQENECWLPRRGQGAQQTAKVDRAEDWFNALPPLLGMPSYFDLSQRKEIPRPGAKGLWMCPVATLSDSLFYFAYGMNMRLSVSSSERPDQIDRVAPTDRQVFLADGPGAYCSILPSVQPFSPTARHDNAVNIAFLDGHVSRFAGDYVGCGKGDPRRPDVRWLVPGSTWTGPHE